jgi:hypothetical protein
MFFGVNLQMFPLFIFLKYFKYFSHYNNIIIKWKTEQPVSHKLQHSIPLKRLGYYAQGLVILLRSQQPINKPSFFEIKNSAAIVHLLI